MTDLSSETGTSLVAVSSDRPAGGGRYRPSAPITAQLFAAKLDLPQARARRRASLEEGVAAYGATGRTIRIGRRPSGASWPA